MGSNREVGDSLGDIHSCGKHSMGIAVPPKARAARR